jgi:hypothetical protein
MVKIRSPREVSREIDRLLDKARKFLPVTRGGKGRKKVAPVKRRKPRPLTKTYQHTPTIPSTPAPTGDAVRWRPTTGFIPSTPISAGETTMRETTRDRNIRLRQERQEAQPEFTRELRATLDLQPDPESALMDLFDVAEANGDQQLENALAQISATRPRQFESFSFARAEPKKKRKVSAYSKRFGIELKKLKKLHPRTKVQNLMKRAHRATKRAMK